MNGLKKSLGLTAAFALLAFTTTAASLPPNLARSTKATATSESSGQYLAQFAVDGKIPEAGSQDDLGQAWCVRGDTHRNGAELTLEWTNTVTIAEVVYYGRTAWFAEECWKHYEVTADGAPAPKLPQAITALRRAWEPPLPLWRGGATRRRRLAARSSRCLNLR